jgi:hypothetical protein
MDDGAKAEAASVRDLLERAGIPAVAVDEHAPDVVEGAIEIRVHPENQARAEALIAKAPDDDELAEPDPSHQYDQEAVFSGEGITAEMEALGIQGVLSANGIGSMIVGSSSLPILRFEVRVAAEDYARAVEVLAEARAAGPAAAEEAERATERATE